MTIRLLAMSGSSRKDSVNQKLLDHAVLGAIDEGAQVTSIRLADYDMPLYDGDLEEESGIPEGARTFQALVAEHDGLLIATPEHNGGYTALLKNALDWLSRPLADGTSGLTLVSGKTAALVSASPGILGGVRSQTAMRIVLEKLGMLVIPQSIALGGAYGAFDDQGRLTDPKRDSVVRSVGASLVRVTRKVG
jgi:chromate reductase